VVSTGIFASLVAHGSELTTPKYFYYIVPFLLVAALVAVDALIRQVRVRPPGWHRPAAIAAALALVLADGFLGLRTLTEAQRYFVPAPTLASLLEFKWKDREFALVIGPGELLLNVDAFRVRTGKWFAPASWHREKLRVQADLATLRGWLAGPGDLTLYCSSWLTAQVAARELFSTGFRPPEGFSRKGGVPGAEEWRRAGQVVHLGFLGYAGSPYQPPGPAPASSTGERTYFLGEGAPDTLTELAGEGRWHLQSATRTGLLTLYRHQ